MILKHILFKNFILKTIKTDYNIINIILFIKKLTNLYIIGYIQSILNKQLLIINHVSMLQINLKITKLFTNYPYIGNTKIDNFINNWKVLQKQLLLLKWITYLINLISKNKIKLPFCNIIKLFKKFIILQKNYWTIINLKFPSYIFIFSTFLKHNLFKNYIKYNKHILFITTHTLTNFASKQSTIISPNILCFKLILELIVISYIQGKY